MRLKKFVNRLARRRRLRFSSVYARIIETLSTDEHTAADGPRFNPAKAGTDRLS